MIDEILDSCLVGQVIKYKVSPVLRTGTEICPESHVKPVIDLGREVEGGVKPVCIGVRDNPAHRLVPERSIDGISLICLCKGQVVSMGQTFLIVLFQFRVGAAILTDTYGTGIRNGSILVPSTLRGDQNDAVGSSCTVNGGSCGIFEDINRLDVVGIDHVDVDINHSVNHVQGSGTSVENPLAPDVHRVGAARASGSVVNHVTGDLPGQSLGHIESRRPLGDLIRIYGRDRG